MTARENNTIEILQVSERLTNNQSLKQTEWDQQICNCGPISQWRRKLLFSFDLEIVLLVSKSASYHQRNFYSYLT